MEEVFSYIIGLGAAVMMPIIFTILGVCIGIKLSKALKSGLLVGVGFVGLSVVTALLTSSLGPALSKVVEIYGLQLKVFDMGWPAFCLYRSSSLFCDKQHSVGILCCHYLLHHHLDFGRLYSRQVSGLL